MGHAATMPDRNNYANNDVGILYRLYLMYLMYVHNYSVQSVDSSERMIVMLCAYLNSFPYRILYFYFFICLIRLQRYKNSAKSFCVAAKKWLDFIQLFLAMSELKPRIWLKRKSWILPARKLQLFRIIFILCGARCYDTR